MSASATRRGLLGAMAVAPMVIAAPAMASGNASFRSAARAYESAMRSQLRFERDVHEPAYAKWKAAGLPQGDGRRDFDVIHDRLTELEGQSSRALDAALDTPVSSLAELREKTDLLNDIDGWEVEDWRRGLIADIRRLAAS